MTRQPHALLVRSVGLSGAASGSGVMPPAPESDPAPESPGVPESGVAAGCGAVAASGANGPASPTEPRGWQVPLTQLFELGSQSASFAQSSLSRYRFHWAVGMPG